MARLPLTWRPAPEPTARQRWVPSASDLPVRRRPALTPPAPDPRARRRQRWAPPRLGWLLGGLLLTGCAAWHDLFQRDRSNAALLAQTLQEPAPPHTDVAIALGCPADGDGTASECLQCRVRAAVKAVREQRMRAIIFSGGAAHNRYVEGEVMAELASQSGIPRDRILIEGQSLTTWQNLRYAQRIMRDHGFETALLISAKNHLPRARRFAEYYQIPVAVLGCEE